MEITADITGFIQLLVIGIIVGYAIYTTIKTIVKYSSTGYQPKRKKPNSK